MIWKIVFFILLSDSFGFLILTFLWFGIWEEQEEKGLERSPNWAFFALTFCVLVLVPLGEIIF